MNPFSGDWAPSRVPLFELGRPSMPFPHLWNYDEPLGLFDAMFWSADRQTGSGKHNRYLSVPGMPMTLVSREPAIIRAILSATGDKPGQLDRDTFPTRGIARATGADSLLYSNGAQWRHQKQLAAPAFSRSNLFQPEKFHEFEVTFRRTVTHRMEAMRARLAETGRSHVRIPLEPEISVVMLEMLVNNFFGGSVSYDELRNRYVPALTYSIDHMIKDTMAHRLRVVVDLVTGQKRKVKEAHAAFEALTDIALAGRTSGAGLWAEFRSDASNDALRSNIRVFLAGALEATTSFASWTLAHLSRRPDVQERVHNEVKSVNVYDPQALGQAAEVNRVLEETLRLTPSLYFLPRWTTVDTEVETADGRKVRIPNHTRIMLDVWHANRCEDFWGVDVSGYPAESFAPERWDVLAGRGRSHKDILHFGFGYGPRVCPGKFLGMLEVALVVGAFVKIFRFKAVNEKLEARAGVSTKPADGALVDLELR
jgi:cytochrome P450